ncbi:cytochrome P450 2G1-like isoform X2 [Hyperolius riggenbachi]|uniref:cytochrome P450 2G1-like isoform X2 n=1 Tax=Hyperolius riggenbachi TaxID=752182 RepID=UPI0035A36FF5
MTTVYCLADFESFMQFWRKYGDVFTIWMGPYPAVVLCGYKTIKEALITFAPQFSERWPVAVTGRLVKGYGIVTRNGEHWQQTKRFPVTTLRNFGMGKRSMEERVQEEAQHLLQAVEETAGKRSLMEERVQEEAQHLLQAVEETAGKPFDPQSGLGRAVNVLINLVVFGRRWDYEDKTFLKFIQIINNMFVLVRNPLGVVYNIFHKTMDHLPGPHQKVFQDCEEVKSFIKEEIQRHKRSFNPDSPRDFIDCFLIQAEKESEEENRIFCEENLLATIFEMFVGGTDTTANTLQFALLAMISYPRIQEQMQKELDEVIGPDRLPGIADRFQLPYSNAVVHEVMRFVDISPLGVAHKMAEDTKFRGCNIPKGTKVFVALASSLADPEQWKNPYEFDPENFLDDEGNFCKQEALIPFSIGRRVCPGEGLARMEVFLFITALLQKFTFHPANPTDTFNLKERRRDFRKKGLSFHLIAEPRTGMKNGLQK